MMIFYFYEYLKSLSVFSMRTRVKTIFFTFKNISRIVRGIYTCSCPSGGEKNIQCIFRKNPYLISHSHTH